MDLQLRQLHDTTPPEYPAELTAAALQQIERRLIQEVATLRGEMRECESALRRDSQALGALLRGALDDRHGELLKWGLLFWIGQAAATASIVAGLLLLTFG